MEMEIKPRVKIEDGEHTGKITGVEYKKIPYKYKIGRAS